MQVLRYLLVLCGMVSVQCSALTIDVTKGVIATIPLAFPGFEGDSAAGEIASVVGNDLKNSGVFNVLGARGLQSPTEAFMRPALSDWRSAGPGATLLAGLARREGGNLVVDFRLYDIGTGRMIAEMHIKGIASQWRIMAHKIANQVYQRMTGEEGYFDTQIVYTAQYGPATKKTRRIAIIDQDGANSRFLTSERRMALTPRCSPVSRKITYSAFHGFKLMGHLLDLNTGEDIPLPMKGLNISPRFSPDGRNLLCCLANNGTTSIYLFNLANGSLTRLTAARGIIDVSPSYSPDGGSLVFASDRGGGRPKLYVMPASGSASPRCISTGQGSYHCPVWSPDGNWIAFVKYNQGQYFLGVVAPDGTKERMIACDHVIERPSWGPNGRMLVFAAQGSNFGPFHLHIVDLTGRSLRKLTTAQGGQVHEGNHPDWSPHPDVLDAY